jgi:hypothetical protein
MKIMACKITSQIPYAPTVQQHDDYTPDVEIINRFSRDTVLLPRGRTLNDMCIQTGLIILNGRCIGDLTGNFTCHNFHGSSVVDYACVSECLLPKLKLFNNTAAMKIMACKITSQIPYAPTV